jgi:predicted ATPase/DNA-binding SARP family transcriptional activator
MGGNSGRMRVELLGGSRLSIGEREVPRDAWRLRKAWSMAKLLALAPAQRLHRDELIERLWPGVDPAAGRNDLKQALHAARRAVEREGAEPSARPFFRLHDGMIVLSIPPADVDVDGFIDAVAEARRARDRDAYRAALRLYRGDLLPEDQYEDWVVSRREELRDLYHAAMLEAADLEEAAGDAPAASGLLRALIAREPAHEEAHGRLMRLYAGMGQRQRALRQYEELRAALRRDLDAEPDPASRRLLEEIRDGKLALTSLIVGQATALRRHNLPVALTSFVGRGREIDAAIRGLERDRLVTLTGPGGCGKTRLALEVARRRIDAFPGGVWVADVAEAAETRDVERAVAAVFGLREMRERSAADVLEDRLRGEALLLVLDGVDRVVEPAALLAYRLLSAAPGLRVVATSREPLRVEGEAILPVPPLALPDLGPSPALAELARCEAIELFCDRARLARADFALTPENAATVTRLCRRLDGLPLAIELAAARVRTLSLDELTASLDDRFRVLARGARGGAARHQTLRATIDHSHDLLSEPERVLFRRLAVFAGGWTLEVARGAVAFGAIAADAVADLLSRLVDRSLAVVEADPRGEVRYGFLETMRAYADERLRASGELAEVRARHARHFLAFAERADRELSGPRQRTWLLAVEREHDNLRAALRCSIDSADAHTALRLGGALATFWWRHSHFNEGRRWLADALALDDGAHTGPRARALAGLGVLAWRQDDYSEARERYEQGLALYRELDDRAGMAECLMGLTLLTMGDFARSEADHDLARTRAEGALALFRDAGDEWGIGRALYLLGRVALESGDQARARALFEDALSRLSAHGDLHGVAQVSGNLAAVERAAGERATARSRIEKGLTIHRDLGDRLHIAYGLSALGDLAIEEGDHRAARALLTESLATCRELGETMGAVRILESLVGYAAARGLPGRAHRIRGAAAAMRERIGRSPSPSVSAAIDRSMGPAPARLSEERRAALTMSGRGLDPELALAEAFAETDIP